MRPQREQKPRSFVPPLRRNFADAAADGPSPRACAGMSLSTSTLGTSSSLPERPSRGWTWARCPRRSTSSKADGRTPAGRGTGAPVQHARLSPAAARARTSCLVASLPARALDFAERTLSDPLRSFFVCLTPFAAVGAPAISPPFPPSSSIVDSGPLLRLFKQGEKMSKAERCARFRPAGKPCATAQAASVPGASSDLPAHFHTAAPRRCVHLAGTATRLSGSTPAPTSLRRRSSTPCGRSLSSGWPGLSRRQVPPRSLPSHAGGLLLHAPGCVRVSLRRRF